jgi:sRNA-binding carbon storage regulator CsrA
MLILEVANEEKIVIDATKPARFTIQVTKQRDNKVKLGFNAPPEVKIDREKVAAKKAVGL